MSITLNTDILGQEVPLGRVDKALKELWGKDEARTKASLMNFAIYSEDPESLEANTKLLAEITEEHACRGLLILVLPSDSQPHARAWITAHCQLHEGHKSVCSEQVSFVLEGGNMGQVRNIVFAHLDSDLPLVCWWQGDLTENFDERFYSVMDLLFVDSATWKNPAADFAKLKAAQSERTAKFRVYDLAWLRSHLFRTAIASCFADAAALSELRKLQRLELTHCPMNRMSALLLVAWLGVRLKCTLEASEGRFRLIQPSGEPVQISLEEAGRLAIRNALVVQGNGTPAEGPYDIIVEGNRIVEMVGLDPVAVSQGSARRPQADREIDASGKYVLPGLINLHGHLQDERAGLPQPFAYQFKLWLASGVTTVRDVSSGGDARKFIDLKTGSAAGTLEAPRLYLYSGYTRGPAIRTAEQARARVREVKALGVDGIKIGGMERDLMAAMQDEARKVGLPIAHHVGVEETTAWDDVNMGTRSIEHWYGVPDAAFPDGVQPFPSDFNYNDETHRFRYAGRIWREADPGKLGKVLQAMVDSNVAWDPTLVIYEASRDLQRAQTQPWFKDYLHPTLEEFFRPNPANHGSYFIGWSSTDETYWRENYRIWMAALRDFSRRGGLIGAGEDAGFIYQMYGFGLIRELELHQEAGFHPLKVIQHATANNARILGREAELGRVRVGFLADLIVVNGNPLEDLKVLYPTGTTAVVNGKEVRSGGIEWTVKDGIPYHGPRLMREVKDLVAAARAAAPQKR